MEIIKPALAMILLAAVSWDLSLGNCLMGHMWTSGIGAMWEIDIYGHSLSDRTLFFARGSF